MIDWDAELKRIAGSPRQALLDALEDIEGAGDVLVITRRDKDDNTDTFTYYVNDELTSGGAVWMLEHCKLKLLTES